MTSRVTTAARWGAGACKCEKYSCAASNTACRGDPRGIDLIVSRDPRAKWQGKAPTRPFHEGAIPRASHLVSTAVSVSGARTAPPPLGLEKARAVLTFDKSNTSHTREDTVSAEQLAEGEAEEIAEEQSAAGDGAPSAVRRSTAPPPNDFDQWFASTRPPAPSLPEVVVAPRLERRPRLRVGLVAVSVAVGVSTLILVGAVVARARSSAALAHETSNVLDTSGAPSANASTASTGAFGPQTTDSATSQVPTARQSADTPVPPRPNHIGNRRQKWGAPGSSAASSARK
jgi:hypothetical protein